MQSKESKDCQSLNTHYAEVAVVNEETLGFLWSGEAVAPSELQYDPDLTLCSQIQPKVIQMVIKASHKTDPFRQGVSIYIGATSSQLCPLAAVMGFMVKGEIWLAQCSYGVWADVLLATDLHSFFRCCGCCFASKTSSIVLSIHTCCDECLSDFNCNIAYN